MHEVLIRQLAAVRAAAQPDLASRCDKAIALVLTGKVHLAGPTQALVDSYREPGVQYTVNGTCGCQDAKHGAPDGWCAHKLAVDLVRACPPEPSAPPLPEAAFSLCLKGRLGGVEAQLTVRGSTVAEFAANVAAVRGLLDAPTAASQPSAAAAQPQEEGRTCPLHQVPMKVQVNAKGSWWSHKTADGSWCKGK